MNRRRIALLATGSVLGGLLIAAVGRHRAPGTPPAATARAIDRTATALPRRATQLTAAERAAGYLSPDEVGAPVSLPPLAELPPPQPPDDPASSPTATVNPVH